MTPQTPPDMPDRDGDTALAPVPKPYPQSQDVFLAGILDLFASIRASVSGSVNTLDRSLRQNHPRSRQQPAHLARPVIQIAPSLNAVLQTALSRNTTSLNAVSRAAPYRTPRALAPADPLQRGTGSSVRGADGTWHQHMRYTMPEGLSIVEEMRFVRAVAEAALDHQPV